MEELVFTPAAVLDLLAQIEELQQYDIGVSETPDGVQVQIGESIYLIPFADATDIEVPEDVSDEIADLNEETYENISYADEVSNDYIESGLLKEVVKTLLVGGVARLVNKFVGGNGN
jgi:hypothetical protein